VQLTVLVLIRGNMPVRQSDLGRTLEMKRGNVVTLLDDLIRRGLVVRRPAEDDRRSNLLTLTARGISLTDELMTLHGKLEQDLAKNFGKPELVRLVELLHAFRNLDPEPRLD
jgi:DNA-binding MarR family transcriptional regulator